MIYWFTGQSGSGKTTLAKYLENELNNVVHVDGDDLREVFINKDYSEIGRRLNIQRAQDISLFLNNKGFNVVVSLVSPYKDQREAFKNNEVVEIYVHTTNIRGREKFHVNYEKPIDNFIDIDTTDKSEEDTVKELLKKINE
jgi:adenylylsulfate kinase-like enzyme